MNQYVILMREDDNAWARLDEREQVRLFERYNAWVGELKTRGIFKGGVPLGEGGRILRAEGGQVVESAMAETRQVLTGYFIVDAFDMDEAVAIARGCPALTHGETIEVRPIGHM